jgi:hypothetical protein
MEEDFEKLLLEATKSALEMWGLTLRAIVQ